MTTKPKAKKFRIRRSTPQHGLGSDTIESAREALPSGEIPAPQAQPPQPRSSATTLHARPEQPAQPAAPQPPQKPAVSQGAPTPPEQGIDAIKREGLTGRQLRMARRMAQKNGLGATSDYDAVRLLRANGLDPFQHTNMLELITAGDGDHGGDDGGRVQLPQTLPMGGNTLPSTELNTQSPAERRAREISEIQKDIAKRRRRRMALLFTRLSAFVFLPTLLAGWYFFAIATPMYSTKSEFLILQADNAGGSGIGSFLSGTQFATNQDSIATQSFLSSKDAMVRLDKDENFKEHFANPDIDPLQRLPENPTNEQAYRLYKKYVKVGYDPTEGVIRMEVSAADPEVSAEFSRALISYAEQRVDDLSQRKREDQMRDARKGLDKATADRRDAQAQLVSLQEGSIIDPEGLIASLRSQISNVQIQLQEKELQLAALEDNPRPNRARVEGVKGDVGRLKDLQAQLEAKMTNATAGDSSLAQKTAQIQMAQADLATADLLMQTALQTLKQTELEANRQVRYLTTSVQPVASQDPSYPRAFEDTMLAFLIFSGIYLMISLTASILREQVSS